MKYIFTERNIEEVQIRIKVELEKKKLPSKEIARVILLSEDILNSLYRKNDGSSSGNRELTLRITGILGNTELSFSMQGDELRLDEICPPCQEDGIDEEVSGVISGIFRKLGNENVSVKHFSKRNTVTVTARRSPYEKVIRSFTAILLGVIAGILIKTLLPENAVRFVSNEICSTVTTLFFNAIKMVIGPLVFFSIASSAAGFTDFKVLGRLGAKVIGLYFITSIFAIFMAVGISMLIPIGDPALASAVDAPIPEPPEGSFFSMKAFITGIVPYNIVDAFADSNMLQIIFIAVLLGIATGTMGEYSCKVKKVLDIGNDLFNRVISIIISFMPAVIFCSTANMVITLEASNIGALASLLGVFYITEILMLVVYGLILLVFGKTNPLRFYRDFSPAMLVGFSLASSSATVPTSIGVCRDKLKIAPQLYSFSIPLGATINMAGTCILQCLAAFFMARVFGVSVTGSVFWTMVIMIFVLSVGAPGVTGSSLVIMASIFSQICIPADAVSLIVGLYPVFAMMLVMVNITGDAAMTMVVAKKEHLTEY